jgi:NTP pyrophosphatase (non-canonical NTP hydrolase)
MATNNFEDIVNRSLEIRKKYHELELQHHGSEWTVEEDALAFLTDAGLVGRNIMSQQQRWPKANSESELEHKLGESIWWLIVLANRSDIDIKEALERFLSKTEKLIGKE